MLMTLGCALGLMMNAGNAVASKKLIEDDLRLQYVNLPKSTFYVGEGIHYTVAAQNTFLDQSSKYAFIEMFVSNDAILSADDNRLSTPMDDSVLVPYGVTNINLYDIILAVPENIGSKYLIFVIDYADRVAERAEWNNTYAIPVTITADPSDMELRSMSAPSVVSYDQGFNVPFSWRQSGSYGAGFPSTKFYLSTDANYSSNDLFVGNTFAAEMVPNQTYYSTQYININRTVSNYSWPTGDYYIIGVSQFILGLDIEENQSNNIKVSPIRVNR